MKPINYRGIQVYIMKLLKLFCFLILAVTTISHFVHVFVGDDRWSQVFLLLKNTHQ